MHTGTIEDGADAGGDAGGSGCALRLHRTGEPVPLLPCTGGTVAPGPVVSSSPEPDGSPSPTPPTTDTLARSVVQVVGLDEEGSALCTGSGTLLDAEGTILTNFHVVENSGDCAYSWLGIGVTNAADEPAELTYLADVHAVSPGLDLAVLRISTTPAGQPYDGRLPFVDFGDSDQVGLGDPIRILGYPGIGGATITFTEGQVSGFIDAPGVLGRAWLKTDATIAGGNSGGLAVDADGRIIGVPTLATGNPDGEEVTDCRIVQDTNGDDELTEEDTCIPIGGFLNSLRPFNLARPLIDEAATAEPIPVEELRPDPVVSQTSASITDVAFAVGSGTGADPSPEDIAPALPSGVDRVCAYLGYEGMGDGLTWDAVWSRDGVVEDAHSFFAMLWDRGEAGSTWWCTVDLEGSVAPGLWELSVYLEGDESPHRSRSVYVGDEHAPVDLAVLNELDVEVCYLYASPVLAQTYEEDLLGEGSLAAGDQVDLELGAGSYDLLAEDCDEEAVVRLDQFDVFAGAQVVLE